MGIEKVRVQCQRLVQQADRLRAALAGHCAILGQRLQVEIVRLGIAGRPLAHVGDRLVGQGDMQAAGDPGDQVGLGRPGIVGGGIEAFHPDDALGLCLAQFGADRQSVTGQLHGAGQNVTDAQFLADLSRSQIGAGEGACRRGRDHEEIAEPRQVAGHAAREPVDQVLPGRVPGPVRERQDDDRGRVGPDQRIGFRIAKGIEHPDGRAGQDRDQCNDRRDHGPASGLAGRARRGFALAQHLEGTDRPGDVLEFQLAQIRKLQRQPVAHLVADRTADHDPAGRADALQAGRHVDAVAQQVLALGHDIADVEADAEDDPAIPGHVRVAPGHAVLQCQRHADGLDGAAELDQQAVAGGVEQAAVMGLQQRIDQFGAVAAQRGKRSLLVSTDEAGETHHIRREDCRQPALHPHPFRDATLAEAAPDGHARRAALRRIPCRAPAC